MLSPPRVDASRHSPAVSGTDAAVRGTSPGGAALLAAEPGSQEEQAQRALLERPRVSIRGRIAVVFLPLLLLMWRTPTTTEGAAQR